MPDEDVPVRAEKGRSKSNSGAAIVWLHARAVKVLLATPPSALLRSASTAPFSAKTRR
jgi:hypothetical protein